MARIAFPLLVLAVLAVSAAATSVGTYSAQSLGDRLFRDYTQYIPLSVTAAKAEADGWKPMNGSWCNPSLGIGYTSSGSGAPTESSPLSMYFAPSGQVTGVGVTIYGEPKKPLVDAGFLKDLGGNKYQLDVSFRPQSDVCASAPAANLTLGNQLVINQDTLAYGLPVLETEATKGNWTKGSCFSGMGHHYFYDLKAAPAMTWQAANLLPIVLMFNEGKINAFFFASSDVQQGLSGTHMWERIPLPNFAMCKNWCDKSCTFHDTSFFSTMHIYMNDYTEVTCAGGCTIGCCP